MDSPPAVPMTSKPPSSRALRWAWVRNPGWPRETLPQQPHADSPKCSVAWTLSLNGSRSLEMPHTQVTQAVPFLLSGPQGGGYIFTVRLIYPRFTRGQETWAHGPRWSGCAQRVQGRRAGINLRGKIFLGLRPGAHSPHPLNSSHFPRIASLDGAMQASPLPLKPSACSRGVAPGPGV